MYCVKCRSFTGTRNSRIVATKNNRQMIQRICVVCGSKKSKFISGKASRKGFLNDTINSLPMEMHLPGHNFIGPGKKLNKRLNPDMTPKAWLKTINRVDTSAYHHDICYVKTKDTKPRNEKCDTEMLQELDGIYNPTLRERMERGVVCKIIGTKKRFGMGLKKENLIWSDQLADELHKPVVRHFRERKVYVKGIDKIWAADLVDMQSSSKFNRGVEYLLTVIDVFSKFGWMLPLKDRTGVSVANASKEIFKQRKPEKLWTDEGKEFYNKHVNALAPELVVELKCSSISRQTTPTNIDVLDDFVDKYNNTRHSSIKMTPVEASKKKNEVAVDRNLYPDLTRRPMRAKFKIGDQVRIHKKKKLFEMGFTPNWTEEVFTFQKFKELIRLLIK